MMLVVLLIRLHPSHVVSNFEIPLQHSIDRFLGARSARERSLCLQLLEALGCALQALVNSKYGSQRLAEFVSDEGGLTTLPTDLPQIGGVNKIVIDTNLKDSEIYLVNSSRMKIVPMAQGNAEDSGAWRTMDATQPGQDGQKVRILGDFAMELRDTKTHFARLTNIA